MVMPFCWALNMYMKSAQCCLEKSASNGVLWTVCAHNSYDPLRARWRQGGYHCVHPAALRIVMLSNVAYDVLTHAPMGGTTEEAESFWVSLSVRLLSGSVMSSVLRNAIATGSFDNPTGTKMTGSSRVRQKAAAIGSWMCPVMAGSSMSPKIWLEAGVVTVSDRSAVSG